MSTNRIPLAAFTLTIVEGPSYEVQTEDGPAEHIGQFVCVTLTTGEEFFQAFEWRSQASDRLEAIEAFGSVNLAKWDRTHPWGAYRQGTLQQRLGAFGSEWEEEQKDRQGCGA